MNAELQNSFGVLGPMLAIWMGCAVHNPDNAQTDGVESADGGVSTGGAYPSASTVRVPAEWEPQEAIWLQWPQSWERSHEPAFAQMVATIADYEDVHILVNDQRTRSSAESALSEHGGLDPAVINGEDTAAGFSIFWHDVPNDSAWMRDNGPRYVVVDGELRIQNWSFDGWGGAFGEFPVDGDDSVPDAVGEILDLPVDAVDLVHERGDLEFNGTDAVILNWSVIGDPNRNPGLTREEAVAAMEQHFGVQRVVLIEGAPAGDLTGGHVDGIARFIDAERAVVADCGAQSACVSGDHDDAIYDAAAAQLTDAGFEVIRWEHPGAVSLAGVTTDTNYLNWLVGNGFVIAVGFGEAEADAAAEAQLAEWFPDRDVHVIEMVDSWIAGGGAHCHTNDQPAL